MERLMSHTASEKLRFLGGRRVMEFSRYDSDDHFSVLSDMLRPPA
jgi:hypothetical protein